MDLLSDDSASRLIANSGLGLSVAAKVEGVRIESPCGDREILAPHVVLATGGLAANDELFAELDGRGAPLVSAAVETSTGEGLIMARALGGAVAGVGDYLPTFGGMPHPDNPRRVQWVDRPLLVAAERAPPLLPLLSWLP